MQLCSSALDLSVFLQIVEGERMIWTFSLVTKLVAQAPCCRIKVTHVVASFSPNIAVATLAQPL